jgi:hypothetical protein
MMVRLQLRASVFTQPIRFERVLKANNCSGTAKLCGPCPRCHHRRHLKDYRRRRFDKVCMIKSLCLTKVLILIVAPVPCSRSANGGALCPRSNGGTRPPRKRRNQPLESPALYLLCQRRAICLRPERRQARKADRDQQSDHEQACHEAGDPGPTLPRPEPSARGPQHA